MEGISDILKQRQVKKNPHLHSEAHLAADALRTYFGETKDPKAFGRYLGVIKRIGLPRTRAILADLKEQGICNPKLFMFMASQKGVQYQEKKRQEKSTNLGT